MRIIVERAVSSVDTMSGTWAWKVREPGWRRSLIWRRSLGVGRRGSGCGRCFGGLVPGLLLLLLLGGGSALELGGAAEGRGGSGVVDMVFMAGVCVGV